MSTNGIDTILFGNADGEWLRGTEAARSRRADDIEHADAALRADHADAIQRALRIREDEAAVEAVRRLIEQDALDAPQNIQTAAENLLRFGI